MNTVRTYEEEINSKEIRYAMRGFSERLGRKPTVDAMTMTMTHSEKSNICQMNAWPYRQECRGHDPTKKNLLCC